MAPPRQVAAPPKGSIVDAAGVVLLAHLHVVQLARLPQVACADRGHVHQVQPLLLAAEFRPHLQVEVQGPVDVFLDKGVLDADALQFGGEGGMAAVVAPVGVQDPQFGLVGVAPFAGEVVHHFLQVCGAHRQPHLPAPAFQFLRLHRAEAFQHGNRLDGGLVGERKDGKVLLAGLHRIDIVFADLVQRFVGGVPVEDEQLGALDADLRRRVDQVDAVHGRGGPLVELPGQEFHGDVPGARKVDAVRDGVRHRFAEDAVAAFLQQFGGEPVEVIDVQQPERAELQLQVFAKLILEAAGLDLEFRMLLDENTVFFHKRTRDLSYKCSLFKQDTQMAVCSFF